MRSKLLRLFLVSLAFLQLAPGQYRQALPGYLYEFPRDNFNHPDFQTEWWYYTGNVRSAEGHSFGFELTFFRVGVDRGSAPNGSNASLSQGTASSRAVLGSESAGLHPLETAAQDCSKASPWDLRDLYIAHLALSDLDGKRFYHVERANRAGPGIAGVSEPEARIWNENWRIQWAGQTQELSAVSQDFSLHFNLRSAKPPVIHGEHGISQKAAGAGHASHYISLTRLLTSGQLELSGKHYDVTGLAWMDHEFFTSQLAENQVGWDWLSLQFDNNTELMLFHLRRKGGSIDPYSSGTFVDANGRTMHLMESDFQLEPQAQTWKSAVTAAVYPVRWKVSVPKLKFEAEVSTPLPTQELAATNQLLPTYWEGAIRVRGNSGGSAIAGVGYLEMTGYDRPIQNAHAGDELPAPSSGQ